MTKKSVRLLVTKIPHVLHSISSSSLLKEASSNSVDWSLLKELKLTLVCRLGIKVTVICPSILFSYSKLRDKLRDLYVIALSNIHMTVSHALNVQMAILQERITKVALQLKHVLKVKLHKVESNATSAQFDQFQKIEESIIKQRRSSVIFLINLLAMTSLGLSS